MEEGREPTAVLDRRLDERLLERVLGAAALAVERERLRAGVEALVASAEADPGATREALWALRGDSTALQRLEGGLDLAPRRATLALGGAIQLAAAELSAPAPDLRERIPELVRWLEGAW